MGRLRSTVYREFVVELQVFILKILRLYNLRYLHRVLGTRWRASIISSQRQLVESHGVGEFQITPSELNRPGYYNTSNIDGYEAVAEMFARNSSKMILTWNGSTRSTSSLKNCYQAPTSLKSTNQVS
ncbi:hypothetical protein SDJN03_14588, partial [Cucurbita argyrosperma subsp. sororia]